MPLPLILAVLVGGLLAQLAGVVFVAGDVRRDRQLSRDYRERVHYALEQERALDLCLEQTDLDIEEEFEIRGETLAAAAAVSEEDLRSRHTAGRVPGWVGVVLLLVGIVANFTAAIGPLL